MLNSQVGSLSKSPLESLEKLLKKIRTGEVSEDIFEKSFELAKHSRYQGLRELKTQWVDFLFKKRLFEKISKITHSTSELCLDGKIQYIKSLKELGQVLKASNCLNLLMIELVEGKNYSGFHKVYGSLENEELSNQMKNQLKTIVSIQTEDYDSLVKLAEQNLLDLDLYQGTEGFDFRLYYISLLMKCREEKLSKDELRDLIIFTYKGTVVGLENSLLKMLREVGLEELLVELQLQDYSLKIDAVKKQKTENAVKNPRLRYLKSRLFDMKNLRVRSEKEMSLEQKSLSESVVILENLLIDGAYGKILLLLQEQGKRKELDIELKYYLIKAHAYLGNDDQAAQLAAEVNSQEPGYRGVERFIK